MELGPNSKVFVYKALYSTEGTLQLEAMAGRMPPAETLEVVLNKHGYGGKHRATATLDTATNRVFIRVDK